MSILSRFYPGSFWFKVFRFTFYSLCAQVSGFSQLLNMLNPCVSYQITKHTQHVDSHRSSCHSTHSTSLPRSSSKSTIQEVARNLYSCVAPSPPEFELYLLQLNSGKIEVAPTGAAVAVDNAASEQLTTQNGRQYFTLKRSATLLLR